jgi:hypothetical protein
VIVHVGHAVFHEIAGRPQISGADVILAHRLLKNSLPNREYLLLTEAAWRELGREMHPEFDEGVEQYEGFGSVRTFVQRLDGLAEHERETFYALPRTEFAARIRRYAGWALAHSAGALLEQWRRPALAVGWPRRLAFAVGYLAASPFVIAWVAAVQPIRLRRRRAAALRERASVPPTT